jgi:hypothetical protein
MNKVDLGELGVWEETEAPNEYKNLKLESGDVTLSNDRFVTIVAETMTMNWWRRLVFLITGRLSLVVKDPLKDGIK